MKNISDATVKKWGLILLVLVTFMAVVGLVLMFRGNSLYSSCIESWKNKISEDYGCETFTNGIRYAPFECQFDDGLIFTFSYPKSVLDECAI